MSRDRYRNSGPPFRKVFVGNLGDRATQVELEGAFSCFGPLRSVWIARNPPGFAFVEFEDPDNALEAVRALDGSILCGCPVRVELAHTNSRPSDRTPPSPERCYACGERGHYARDCYLQYADNVGPENELGEGFGDISELCLDPETYEGCDWNSVIELMGIQPRTHNQRNRRDDSSYQDPSNEPSRNTAQLQNSSDGSRQGDWYDSPSQRVWFDSPLQQRGDRPPQQNRSYTPQQSNFDGSPPQRNMSIRAQQQNWGPQRTQGDRPSQQNWGPQRNQGDRPWGPQRTQSDRPWGPQRTQSDRPWGPQRTQGDRPWGPQRTQGDTPWGPQQTQGDTPWGPQRTQGDTPWGPQRTQGDRSSQQIWINSPLHRRNDGPLLQSRSNRPPQWYLDDTPPQRYLDDRPPRWYLDDTPTQQYLHDTPPQRYLHDTPPQHRGDRPPQRYLDDRPPPRYLGDRLSQRYLHDTSPQRRGDRPPQRNRSDRPQPQPTSGGTAPVSNKLNDTSDDIKCAICLDTEGDTEMEYLPCGHGFHAKCCNDWLSVNSLCPICRTSVASQSANVQDNPERNVDNRPTFFIGSVWLA